VSHRTLRLRAEIDRPLGRTGAFNAIAGVLAAAVGAIVLAGLVVVTLGSSEYDIVLLFGINAILVVGLQTFVGNTGIMSFGHVAFMGLGAYTAGILTIPVAAKAVVLPGLPGFLQSASVPVVAAIALAAGVALVCGLVAGPLIVRLPESTASIATFALLVVVNNIFQNATSLTRGNQTFYGVPRSVNFGLVFGTLAVVVMAAAAFKWSPLGLRARAVREDPIAAEASGIRVSTARLWPFALSAFITGAAGALWAFDVTAFSSNSFYISQSIGVIAMMILGGYQSVTGVILGATVMSLWLELIRHVENGVTVAAIHIRAMPGLSQLFLGLALVFILRWRPAGLAGSKELQFDLASAAEPRDRVPRGATAERS
jgi:branched-chain amino acid transport system permease protein